MEPDILIVDEVLAVGDAEFQKKCLGKMSDVAGEGRTVLFVSHNLQAVRMLCQYGIWLEGGTVVQQGDVSSVVNNYLKAAQRFDNPVPLQGTSKKDTYLDALRLKSINAPEWGVVQMGDPILLEFKVVCRKPVTGLNLGFGLRSEAGERLAVCYSSPRQTFDLPVGTHVIQAQFDQFNATPGLYAVNGRLEAHGIELDWPRGDAYQFEVIPSEALYGTPQECLINGKFFIQPDWKQVSSQQVGDEVRL
jgi:lipopolysaccharide transport system ATP-binding protein